MTDASKLVPAGISHDDLTRLSPPERMQHHRAQLQTIAYLRGFEGVADYRRTHPEAAAVRVRLDALAYRPKPGGYLDALAAIVGGWLTDDAALARSNRQDVEALNAMLGTDRFNPANHFSKPLASRERRRIANLFDVRGFALPVTVRTLSTVRQAVKAAKAEARPGAECFGHVGTRTPETLTIGSRTFRVERHHGHDCTRVMVGGSRVRLRLDAVLELLAGLGGDGPGDTPLNISIRDIGELAPNAILDPPDPLADTSGATSPGELSPDVQPFTLSDRIVRLAALRKPQAPPAARLDTDPLEL